MNKLIFDTDKGPILLCVLEPGNIHKLKEDKPIEFSLNDPELFGNGLPAKLSIVIAYSETPIADAKEIAKLVKPVGKLSDRRTEKTEKSRPHCPECRSTIEQLGVMRNDSPVWLAFCTSCGCNLGTVAQSEALKVGAGKDAA